MSSIRPLDALPLESVSNRTRDEAAPGFLAHLSRAYGSTDGLGDVLDMLGLGGAA